MNPGFERTGLKKTATVGSTVRGASLPFDRLVRVAGGAGEFVRRWLASALSDWRGAGLLLTMALLSVGGCQRMSDTATVRACVLRRSGSRSARVDEGVCAYHQYERSSSEFAGSRSRSQSYLSLRFGPERVYPLCPADCKGENYAHDGASEDDEQHWNTTCMMTIGGICCQTVLFN